MPNIRKIVFNYLWKITAVMMIAIIIASVGVQLSRERRATRDHAAEMFLQIEQILDENQNELFDVQSAYRKTCLFNAETIAYIIQHNPDVLGDIEELRRIAEFVEVDEIHVFDKTGCIFTGTHPEYYGYTFDSGEQIAFFKPLLGDKSLRLCQDVTPNTAEGKLVQYSALWSSDGEFILQVGMQPSRVLEATEKNELSYIFSLLQASAGVELFAVDAQSGEVMGSTSSEDTGKNISEIGLSLSDMEKYAEGAHATVNGVNSYCIFTAMGSNFIGYVVSNDVLYRNIALYTTVLAVGLVLIAIILVAAIIWCTNRFVIDGIYSTNEKLRSITAGNLDERVDVQSSLEFSELSSHINEMIKHLLSTTDKLSYVLNRTNMHIGVYEYSEKMMSVRCTEQVSKILALDSETAKRLTGNWRLFRAHIDSLRRNPLPDEEDVFHFVGEKDTYIKLEEISNDTEKLGIVMDVTDQITTRKQIEAERDIDLLTQLFNRRGLESRLSSLFDTPDELGCGALIMIDADGLKKINDQYGHSAGDIYLRRIADKIAAFGPHSSVSARVGGDEFVLFLYGYDSEEELLDTIDKLRYIPNSGTARINRELKVPLDFSMGYTLTKGRSDYQAMLKEADERMYSIKRERKKGAEMNAESNGETASEV